MGRTQHGTAPHGRRPRLHGRRRWLPGVAVTALVVGALGALVPPASAAIGAAGPTDPASLFPSYYTDGNDLSLQLCQDGLPLCLAGPEEIQDVHAGGGDAEAFYFHASADIDTSIGTFTLESALEAAYAAEGDGQEVTFQRRQGIARGVRANATYTFTDPYGTYTCVADGSGRVQPSKGCRYETTPVPGEFDRALNGPIGPFVTWDTFGTTGAGAPPAGFIGDGATPHAVVGSPSGFNKMRVSGPGITGTCTNDDGSTVGNCRETDKLVVQGKVADTGRPSASLSAGALDFGDIDPTPAVTRTLTYANTGRMPVTIASVETSGAGAAAFDVTDDCPDTLAGGERCRLDVTFTPEPGKASAATLTLTDDTPVGTRTVALTGSNLPTMVVSAPTPPGALGFGTVPVGTTSPEDNVVIGNTGKGPLTVASATITGGSAAMYELGPNDECLRVTVAPDGGCEIGVQFTPTTTGSKSATLRVTDAGGNIVNVPLTGTGGAADTTAPTATVSPAQGATGVAVGANVTATFSEPVSGVNGTTFTLTGPQGAVAATVGYNATSRVATLNPSADLAAGTTYTARLTSGIRDGASTPNPLAERTWSFTTAAATNPAPTVTGRAPALNATSVAVGANITATFSEAVNGVGTGTFQVKNPGGNVVAATVTRNATTNQWILNPSVNLVADTRYTVTLTGGSAAIRDLQGAPLAGTAAQPLSWSFTTGPAPRVSARTPAVGATAVNRTANITATFSENVQGVTGTTVTLRNAATGAAVTAVVGYNATTRVATLNPSATLAARTQYRVTVTGGANGIRDLAGNPLANVTWTFTTGA